MTDTDASLLAKLEDLAKKASAEIVRISLPGSRGWRMSIPARQDDSDLLFHDLAECAVQAADALRRSGEALRSQAAVLKGAYDFIEALDFNDCPAIKEEQDQILAIIARQSGAEGTEAGGREHPLPPID